MPLSIWILTLQKTWCLEQLMEGTLMSHFNVDIIVLARALIRYVTYVHTPSSFWTLFKFWYNNSFGLVFFSSGLLCNTRSHYLMLKKTQSTLPSWTYYEHNFLPEDNTLALFSRRQKFMHQLLRFLWTSLTITHVGYNCYFYLCFDFVSPRGNCSHAVPREDKNLLLITKLCAAKYCWPVIELQCLESSTN